MRLLQTYDRPDLRGVEYAILVNHRDLAEFHQLRGYKFEVKKLQAKFREELIAIVKKHSRPTARVRWAKKAQLKRRARGF